MYKRFVAYFDIDGKNAVGLNANPTELALNYANCGADCIIITDISKNDADHDAAVSVIADIAGLLPIQIIAAGNIRRLEDVKKYLYAGAGRVILDFTKAMDLPLLEEAAKRFGKERLMVSINDSLALTQCRFELVEFASLLVTYDNLVLKKCLELSFIPILHFMPDVALQHLIEYLLKDKIWGISGLAVNNNIADLRSIKSVCEEAGVNIRRYRSAIEWERLKKGDFGLIPVIVTDHATGEVLMLAYTNEEAFCATLESGRMHYYSRSRKSLWEKGETSGHYQYVVELKTDCDLDTILARVVQIGPACHTGKRSCFFNTLMKTQRDLKNPQTILEEVFSTIKDRHINPKEGSYTNYLFDKGIDKILKKLGEEATEIVIAAKNPDPDEIKYEISDFLYHMMVLMEEKGISLEDVTKELARR